MPTAHLHDIDLAYDEIGSGDRILLLVHGHPFDRSMWRPQLQAAADAGWRVLAPDLRGYGESCGCDETVTLDVFARDLAALLDNLGAARAVLGGLSMGGQIVMEFCRLFPERVDGVVLAATFPQSESESGKIQRAQTADRLLKEGVGVYAKELLPKMLSARAMDEHPELAREVLQMMNRAPPVGAAAALRGRAERPCYRHTLAGLKVPALIVAGDEDAFTTHSDADEMHRLVEGSRLLWMRGVGHMPNLEREAEFNRALVDFLTTIPRKEAH